MSAGAPASARTAQTVAIHGAGVAANGCAHLLSRAGLSTVRTVPPRPAVPAILLSDTALALLRDVFERPDLFADRPRITRRIVAWGSQAPVAVPHGAVVVSEAELDAALSPLPSSEPVGESSASPWITVHAAAPFPAGEMRLFGDRQGAARKIQLSAAADPSACWMEAVEAGWLFMIPAGDGSAWLLAVGGSPDALLDQSRHIAPLIGQAEAASPPFQTSPRLLTALQGPDWLACGSAAVAFDPICGDGTAQAVREAVLSSAVVVAMAEGGDRNALRLHFESMILGAMRRHLRLCAQFYASGGEGPWWRAQLEDLAHGFDWCTARLAAMPEPRFELHGDRLAPRGVAA